MSSVENSIDSFKVCVGDSPDMNGVKPNGDMEEETLPTYGVGGAISLRLFLMKKLLRLTLRCGRLYGTLPENFLHFTKICLTSLKRHVKILLN
jgi:hypothetical protein